jgi:hypothetical protein
MSRPPSPIVCDGPGCGKTKQEANHWWQAAVPKFEVISAGYAFEIRLWSNERRTAHLKASWDLFDFCGQTCALKFISERMGESNAK